MATWLYMPSSNNKESPFFCDDCVLRGCECNWRSFGDNTQFYGTSEKKVFPQGIENVNWKYVNAEKNCWTFLDEKQREFPCCEYDYDENGYELENDEN